MKATYDPERETKFTATHRKEKSGGLREEIAALVPSLYSETELHAVVILRTYNTSGGRTNTACLWVNDPKLPRAVLGSGSAGGNGYDRSSAAAQEAIDNAGFDLDQDIGGQGSEHVRKAVLAIAVCLGYPEAKLHTAHS